ncbi:formylglycine-generating enzyme family protein [Fluviicola chungangensis]|uniref:SUMF1/EgtB/PvdOfamily nonheme iron enzyme n=1 Tax=Fluviicola chungangensis TaxID=2597671 RepID=A0A556N185_9FLAO|nr:SUMF1/EgtB/PvdO family nonheme iron enzyme [Fluviicola chungangensis]TSJ45813.1 SUMF1/EgtB/PvdOfamily nonheme iron enzyme [Fluviicola chungangensis]
MKRFSVSIFIFLVTILFLSFAKPKKPISDLEGMKNAAKDAFSYIPPGKTIVDGDTVTCQGFFISQKEVSNLNYQEYLDDLKKTGKMKEYRLALVDSAKWNSTYFQGEKYVTHYFNHKAYKNYPVVNITRQQAEKYCEWLTQIWREYTKNQSIIVRLPKRAEFLRAANGSSMDRPYAWNSPYIRTEKGKMMANFLQIDGGCISRDTLTGKLILVTNSFDYIGNGDLYADVTAPVESYFPNEFGIFHLNGNVSEMVAEQDIAVGGDWNSPGFDIRNQSMKKFTEANPMVGFRPVMTFSESSKK